MVLSNTFDGSRQKHASRAVILESPRPAASYALNAVRKSRHTYSACLKQVQSDSRRMTPPKQELSAFSAQPTVNASDAAMRWGGIGVVSLLVETRTWNIDTACSCIFCSYLGDVSWKVRFFGTWFLRKRCRFKVLYIAGWSTNKKCPPRMLDVSRNRPRSEIQKQWIHDNPCAGVQHKTSIDGTVWTTRNWLC